MLDSPQSQENITKFNKLDSPQSQEILQKFKYVRQSIVTRKYYKNLSMLDSPQSQENITKI